MFLLVNLITGSVFLQTLTHIQIFTHIFIHSKIFFTVVFYVFFCFQFSCKFLYLPIVPWSHFGGLQPITQIIFCLFVYIFCTSTTTSRSSWGWGANFWLFFTRNTGFIFVFVSVNFVFQWGQIDVLYKIFSRSNFRGLVVQFVTFLKFLGGTSTIQVEVVVFTIKIPFWV